MKHKQSTLMVFSPLLLLLFTSFHGKVPERFTKLPPTKTYTLTVTISNSCNPTNWSVSYKCGSGSSGGSGTSVAFNSVPIVGGGGSGNPHGHDILEYLYYQSLSPEQQILFKQSAFASDVVKNQNKFNEIAAQVEAESPKIAIETQVANTLEMKRSLLEMQTEINKIQDPQLKEKLNTNLKNTMQKAQIRQQR